MTKHEIGRCWRMKILPFEGDSMDDSIEKDYKAKNSGKDGGEGCAPSHLLTIMMKF